MLYLTYPLFVYLLHGLWGPDVQCQRVLHSIFEALCGVSEQGWLLQCEIVSLAPNPSWRTTSGGLSTTAFSIYSQLTSISVVLFPHVLSFRDTWACQRLGEENLDPKYLILQDREGGVGTAPLHSPKY